MPRHAEGRIAVLLLLLAAGTAAGQALHPFTATYSTALNGMPLGIDLKISLAADNAEHWQVALTAGSSAIRYAENSVFRWQDCQASPLRYRYDFRGFGFDRKLWLDFDYGSRTARGESRRGPLTYTFPPDTTDELALLLSASCRLQQGVQATTFNVATYAGVKTFDYRVDGTERIRTGAGPQETLRVVRVREKGDRRRSTIWLAPALGYMMVKMEHVEKLGVRGMIVLKKLEGGMAPPPAGSTAEKPATEATPALTPSAR